MKKLLKQYAIILLIMVFLSSVAGCGTIKGIGSDFKKAGKGIGKGVGKLIPDKDKSSTDESDGK